MFPADARPKHHQHVGVIIGLGTAGNDCNNGRHRKQCEKSRICRNHTPFYYFSDYVGSHKPGYRPVEHPKNEQRGAYYKRHYNAKVIIA